MPRRSRSGRFVKTTAIARTSHRSPARSHTRYTRRRRHGGGSGGGVAPIPLALATAGLAYATKNFSQVNSLAMKIPGAKTWGAPAALGLACLAIDKFAYKNKWLKLAGFAGIVLAAANVGDKGSSFQWMGDGEQVSLDGDDLDEDDAYDAANG